MIQRTANSGNVTQDNGNINKFWKGSCCTWWPFVIS